MDKIIRVVVVDDSSYVRKVIKQMLSRSPFIDVIGAARDGVEALEMVETLNPDVVVSDLIMPRMDGIAFLREQMARKPVPVVVVSITNEGGELALAALDAGAIDFIQKPTALATEKIFEVSDELIQKVKAASTVSMKAHTLVTGPGTEAVRPSVRAAGERLVDIVVIGISTGGPQALKYLIPQFPADFSVPIAVVLHMPVGYTELYARKLNELSQLDVREAQEGDRLTPGVLLLAAAGRHLSLQRQDNGTVTTHLDTRPFDTPHRPSVDVLFQSTSEIYRNRTLGVVMTGMGSDGKQGSAWIKAQGGLVYTEAEETCVVYGMPRSVVEAGLSDRSEPLDRIARAIMEVV
ncbi:MAG TPA: chemotaxis-specific protein-glutamate methyltransferase CheB [Blastocatellia bacterium]|nr:chemotaxis-specific protein-glutamate methyltransferase CheB [Blastocatellia bacterium]